jgi:hypothetical protein
MEKTRSIYHKGSLGIVFESICPENKQTSNPKIKTLEKIN